MAANAVAARGRHRMRHLVIGLLASAFMAFALTGCDSSGGSSGTPGSATVYMHGRVGTEIGGFSH